MEQQIYQAIDRIKEWYGGECPPEVLADQFSLTTQQAEEYIRCQPKPKSTPKKVEPVKQVEQVVVKEENQEAYHNLALTILPWASVVIAVAALLRQIIFIITHFNRTENIFIAVLMALIIGLITLIGPSVSIASIQNRQWWVFVLSLAVVGVFAWLNIDITVKELQHSSIASQESSMAQVDEISRAKDRVKQIDTILSNTKINISNYTKEFNAVLTKSQMKDLKSWEYDRHRENLSITKKKLEFEESELKRLTDERNSLTNIAGYYTVDTDKRSVSSLDIWLAIGLEIAGPMFTIFALYLRRRRNE